MARSKLKEIRERHEEWVIASQEGQSDITVDREDRAQLLAWLDEALRMLDDACFEMREAFNDENSIKFCQELRDFKAKLD